jgi:hypothetical protein
MLLHFLGRGSQAPSASCKFDGWDWRLEAYDLNEIDREQRHFSCISYSWGTGRVASPFHGGFEVSDRTTPALATFMKHRPSCKHVWIDAFCVPTKEPERSQTLENMGYIYSRAEEVVVVLSPAARPALLQMTRLNQIQSEQLDMLEREEWVSRAWTYQEAVNSKRLFFTCEGSDDTIVSGHDFLNCLGYSLTRLEGSNMDRRQRFPRLDAFEDVIADTMLAGYQERSALHVMSNMDRRTQGRPADHFYAMIGAISTVLSSSLGNEHPCEVFMSLCDSKGDYSYIYSAAKRDGDPLQRWRPAKGDLPSILPWTSSGESQPGHIQNGTLYLEDMMVLQESPLNNSSKRFIEEWLTCRIHATGTGSELHSIIYDALRVMGFNGSSKYFSTQMGYFYPFEAVESNSRATVYIATAVRWVFGAPGLLCHFEGGAKSYVPGAFVGLVEASMAKAVMLD